MGDRERSRSPSRSPRGSPGREDSETNRQSLVKSYISSPHSEYRQSRSRSISRSRSCSNSSSRERYRRYSRSRSCSRSRSPARHGSPRRSMGAGAGKKYIVGNYGQAGGNNNPRLPVIDVFTKAPVTCIFWKNSTCVKGPDRCSYIHGWICRNDLQCNRVNCRDVHIKSRRYNNQGGGMRGYHRQGRGGGMRGGRGYYRNFRDSHQNYGRDGGGGGYFKNHSERDAHEVRGGGSWNRARGRDYEHHRRQGDDYNRYDGENGRKRDCSDSRERYRSEERLSSRERQDSGSRSRSRSKGRFRSRSIERSRSRSEERGRSRGRTSSRSRSRDKERGRRSNDRSLSRSRDKSLGHEKRSQSPKKADSRYRNRSEEPDHQDNSEMTRVKKGRPPSALDPAKVESLLKVDMDLSQDTIDKLMQAVNAKSKKNSSGSKKAASSPPHQQEQKQQQDGGEDLKASIASIGSPYTHRETLFPIPPPPPKVSSLDMDRDIPPAYRAIKGRMQKGVGGAKDLWTPMMDRDTYKSSGGSHPHEPVLSRWEIETPYVTRQKGGGDGMLKTGDLSPTRTTTTSSSTIPLQQQHSVTAKGLNSELDTLFSSTFDNRNKQAEDKDECSKAVRKEIPINKVKKKVPASEEEHVLFQPKSTTHALSWILSKRALAEKQQKLREQQQQRRRRVERSPSPSQRKRARSESSDSSSSEGSEDEKKKHGTETVSSNIKGRKDGDRVISKEALILKKTSIMSNMRMLIEQKTRLDNQKQEFSRTHQGSEDILQKILQENSVLNSEITKQIQNMKTLITDIDKSIDESDDDPVKTKSKKSKKKKSRKKQKKEKRCKDENVSDEDSKISKSEKATKLDKHSKKEEEGVVNEETIAASSSPVVAARYWDIIKPLNVEDSTIQNKSPPPSPHNHRDSDRHYSNERAWQRDYTGKRDHLNREWDEYGNEKHWVDKRDKSFEHNRREFDGREGHEDHYYRRDQNFARREQEFDPHHRDYKHDRRDRGFDHQEEYFDGHYDKDRYNDLKARGREYRCPPEHAPAEGGNDYPGPSKHHDSEKGGGGGGGGGGGAADDVTTKPKGFRFLQRISGSPAPDQNGSTGARDKKFSGMYADKLEGKDAGYIPAVPRDRSSSRNKDEKLDENLHAVLFGQTSPRSANADDKKQNDEAAAIAAAARTKEEVLTRITNLKFKQTERNTRKKRVAALDKKDGTEKQVGNSTSISEMEMKREDEEANMKKEVAPQEKNKVKVPEYIDQGMHWCTLCDIFCETLPQYIEHLMQDPHRAKMKNDCKKLQSSISRPSDIDDISPDSLTRPLQGVEFVHSVTVFHCNLCSLHLDDATHAAKHMHTDKHIQAYKTRNQEDPLYESTYFKDKMNAYAKFMMGQSQATMSSALSTATGSKVSVSTIDKVNHNSFLGERCSTDAAASSFSVVATKASANEADHRENKSADVIVDVERSTNNTAKQSLNSVSPSKPTLHDMTVEKTIMDSTFAQYKDRKVSDIYTDKSSVRDSYPDGKFHSPSTRKYGKQSGSGGHRQNREKSPPDRNVTAKEEEQFYKNESRSRTESDYRSRKAAFETRERSSGRREVRGLGGIKDEETDGKFSSREQRGDRHQQMQSSIRVVARALGGKSSSARSANDSKTDVSGNSTGEEIEKGPAKSKALVYSAAETTATVNSLASKLDENDKMLAELKKKVASRIQEKQQAQMMKEEEEAKSREQYEKEARKRLDEKLDKLSKPKLVVEEKKAHNRFPLIGKMPFFKSKPTKSLSQKPKDTNTSDKQKDDNDSEQSSSVTPPPPIEVIVQDIEDPKFARIREMKVAGKPTGNEKSSDTFESAADVSITETTLEKTMEINPISNVENNRAAVKAELQKIISVTKNAKNKEATSKSISKIIGYEISKTRAATDTEALGKDKRFQTQTRKTGSKSKLSDSATMGIIIPGEKTPNAKSKVGKNVKSKKQKSTEQKVKLDKKKATKLDKISPSAVISSEPMGPAMPLVNIPLPASSLMEGTAVTTTSEAIMPDFSQPPLSVTSSINVASYFTNTLPPNYTSYPPSSAPVNPITTSFNSSPVPVYGYPPFITPYDPNAYNAIDTSIALTRPVNVPATSEISNTCTPPLFSTNGGPINTSIISVNTVALGPPPVMPDYTALFSHPPPSAPGVISMNTPPPDIILQSSSPLTAVNSTASVNFTADVNASIVPGAGDVPSSDDKTTQDPPRELTPPPPGTEVNDAIYQLPPVKKNTNKEATTTSTPERTAAAEAVDYDLEEDLLPPGVEPHEVETTGNNSSSVSTATQQCLKYDATTATTITTSEVTSVPSVTGVDEVVDMNSSTELLAHAIPTRAQIDCRLVAAGQLSPSALVEQSSTSLGE